METLNNAASAASRAIWGDSTTKTTESTESGREPVSGQTGNTADGEPYDAGNTETETQTSSMAGNERATESSPSGASDSRTEPTGAPGNTASTGPIRPEHETDKTGVTSAHQPASGFSSDKPTSSNDNSGPGAAPSVGADPSSGAKPNVKQQGAANPHDEPDHEENQAIKETKKEAEEASKVDTGGPGPKPLSETANKGASSSAEGDDDGPQKESHGTGTGEQYVKSSGLKADGGDFDAANPGAGKEADRLLETKGVHREVPGEASPKQEDKLEAAANKPSLGEKIKAKLHKK